MTYRVVEESNLIELGDASAFDGLSNLENGMNVMEQRGWLLVQVIPPKITSPKSYSFEERPKYVFHTTLEKVTLRPEE